MGKDFTSAKGDDNVYTPYSMTEQLLENEKFDKDKHVLEPACGKGAIEHVLIQQNFHNLMGIDINHEDEYWRTDFLKNRGSNYDFSYIITNPPYSKLDQFIIKAKQVSTEKFAFLCKITHLGGVERFKSKLFRDPDYPLTKIYMFTRQANLRFNIEKENLKYASNILKKNEIAYYEIREDGKYPAGAYYFVWLIFEKNNKCFERQMLDFLPQFRWINNQQYILRKSDSLQ